MKSKRNFAEKPYNRCLFCSKRLSEPKECNGPRTGSMPTDRWREYMRDIKDTDGLTFEEIAERTHGQMSSQSIQNALAPGATGDLTRERARIIENAILGDSIAPPCPFDFLDDISADSKRVMEIEAELEQLRNNIGRTHDFQEKELAAVRADAQKRLDEAQAKHQREIAHLKSQIEYLEKVNDRNAKVIDSLLER